MKLYHLVYQKYILVRAVLVWLRVWAFKPYYVCVARHAQNLYRHSSWFKDLKQMFGTKYAENDFIKGTAMVVFVGEAKQESWILHARMFFDSTFKREKISYLEYSIRRNSLNCR